MAERSIAPYDAWAAGEGVPVLEGAAIDLLAAPTAVWPRLGCDGAIVDLAARGDLIAAFVADLAPGAAAAPQRHLFEAVVYVLAGHGSTTIETAAGRRGVEWGPRSLFALPRNARYRHFNASGRARVRLAVTHDLPALLNLFRDPAFVFANSHEFPARETGPDAPRRHTWETDFVADLGRFDTGAGTDDGARIALADGALRAHLGPRPAGGHVFPVSGQGHTRFRHRNEDVQADWRHGMVFALPAGAVFEHVASEGSPRFLSVGLSFTAG